MMSSLSMRPSNRRRLRHLEMRHAQLKAQVDAMEQRARLTPSEAHTLQQLKKRKLAAKDALLSYRGPKEAAAPHNVQPSM